MAGEYPQSAVFQWPVNTNVSEGTPSEELPKQSTAKISDYLPVASALSDILQTDTVDSLSSVSDSSLQMEVREFKTNQQINFHYKWVIDFGNTTLMRAPREIGEVNTVRLSTYRGYFEKHNEASYGSIIHPDTIDQILRRKVDTCQIRTRKGKRGHACGPFALRHQVNGITMIIDTYIVADQEKCTELTLGGILKHKMRMRWDDEKEEMILTRAAHATLPVRKSMTKMPLEIKILIDTGAKPNVMNLQTQKRLQIIDEELAESHFTLKAANESAMNLKGIAKDVELKFGRRYVKIDVAVVDNIGDDEMILGQDFFQEYHV